MPEDPIGFGMLFYMGLEIIAFFDQSLITVRKK